MPVSSASKSCVCTYTLGALGGNLLGHSDSTITFVLLANSSHYILVMDTKRKLTTVTPLNENLFKIFPGLSKQ